MLGGWRKLHNEASHKSHYSPNIIKMIKEDEMGRACRTHGAYIILWESQKERAK
jgi:hypothetical protein